MYSWLSLTDANFFCFPSPQLARAFHFPQHANEIFGELILFFRRGRLGYRNLAKIFRSSLCLLVICFISLSVCHLLVIAFITRLCYLLYVSSLFCMPFAYRVIIFTSSDAVYCLFLRKRKIMLEHRSFERFFILASHFHTFDTSSYKWHFFIHLTLLSH